MSESYATVQEITVLWRELTLDEQTRAEALLPLVSDALRYEAWKVGSDLDEKIVENAVYGSVVKSVVVDVVARILRQSTSGEAMTQESQSALGYSWSGTYAVPGGGIANAIMNNDLKRLGLRRQIIRPLEIYNDSWNNSEVN